MLAQNIDTNYSCMRNTPRVCTSVLSLFYSDTLDSNWFIVVLVTIRFDTHVLPTISSDATTLHVCKQQAINCY